MPWQRRRIESSDAADTSLDRSGGVVFCNLIGAAKVELNRAARSTLTLGGAPGSNSMRQVPTTISFVAAVPQFAVPDLVRTAEYYRDVLGFQIAGYWDGERVSFGTDPHPVFAIVWRDQVQVFFNRADQSDVRTTRAEDAPNTYLRVIGIDALAEELRARGADILDGPEDRIYGQRELVVKDCNGLILCFGEDTSGRAT
jgi:catechol 2,3-dioxygenase-like lactoylglutathione lyase family enzyme